MRKFILWLCLSIIVGVGLVMSPALTSAEFGRQSSDGVIVLAKHTKKRAVKKKAAKKKRVKKKHNKKKHNKKKHRKKNGNNGSDGTPTPTLD